MTKSNTALPFIFGRMTRESQLKSAYGETPAIKDWVVLISKPDFVIYNSGWMDRGDFGNTCLAPDVDITIEEDKVFSTFEEAREYVKNWWRNND